MPRKIKLVISDFHLARGNWLEDGRRNPLEDFHQDEKFCEMLDYYSTGPFEDADVELIINGDFFDPLVVLDHPKGKWKPIFKEFPEEVEEPQAVRKFKIIIDAHPITFSGLRRFLDRGKRIVFRWGNHDAAILWPEVQTLIRNVLNPREPTHLTFQQDPYIFDRICIDHGHQFEVINSFDEKNIFIERKTKTGTKTILNLPFGSFFVFGFLTRLKLKRSFINQIYPLREYVKLSLLLDPPFFFINGFRVAWFFIKMRFITHPMRFARLKKTFILLFEMFKRPSLENEAEHLFSAHQNGESLFDTLIMGHNHQAAHRTFPGGKQYINTGTWIPITSLDMSTLGHHVNRTYALIEYLDGKPRASLKIWHGTPQITEDFA